jgi:hypothetical protein
VTRMVPMVVIVRAEVAALIREQSAALSVAIDAGEMPGWPEVLRRNGWDAVGLYAGAVLAEVLLAEVLLGEEDGGDGQVR